MKVFTSKEYKELSKVKESAEGKLVELNDRSDSGGKSPPLEDFTWHLLHPENGIYELQNFEDVLKIDGKEYKRKCQNGVVVTKDKVLAEFLISKGYEIIEIDSTNRSTNKSWINELDV